MLVIVLELHSCTRRGPVGLYHDPEDHLHRFATLNVYTHCAANLIPLINDQALQYKPHLALYQVTYFGFSRVFLKLIALKLSLFRLIICF